ncbi:MAG TPA: antibiotic biosynthesis monooxygenase [Leucothrix mucor]|uniref:Antibiotic biosynthesis monooxygenase n=1 Tax=Leucothrix mucor TaxID=45248 RepID=A0A7V2T4N6_LEUMU|nr:antibiotic biosynthesis monooxygenase [Leucothrix mucor]
MPVTVILQAQAKPADIENFKTYIAKCLPETRSYNGCINIDIYEDKNNKGSFIFYEYWESVNAYEAYLEYRTKQGVMEKIGSMLITPPEITYYDKVAI